MSNEYYRYGSARFSTEAELAQAGLLSGNGIPIGYTENNHPIQITSKAGLSLFGGAGSQKLVSYIAYMTLLHLKSLFLDFKGEISAISMQAQIHLGAKFFCWNPYGLFADAPWFLPSNRVNPFEILSIDSPYLHLDCRKLMESMIATPAPNAGSKGDFFIKRAREWAAEILIWMIETLGKTDMPEFYSMLSFMESEPDYWDSILQRMKQSRFENVRRIAGEQEYKKQHATGEYSGVLATIFANLNVLGDPVLQESLTNPDVSISEFCNTQNLTKGSLVVEAEHAQVLQPILKSIFTAFMISKQRAPQAPRILLVMDEAAQLGNFPELIRCYEYGRGANLIPLSVWQTISQMSADNLKKILSNSQTRIFTGIRDIETAELVSRMLGDETLFYDKELEQAKAKREYLRALSSLMRGSNPMSDAIDARYHEYASQYQERKQRRLMTAEEILNMPSHHAINFISDLNIQPYTAHKIPHYEQAEYMGWFMPNPYVPPYTHVTHGNFTRPVISEPVPRALEHLPQYQKGMCSYVQGYRPTFPEKLRVNT